MGRWLILGLGLIGIGLGLMVWPSPGQEIPVESLGIVRNRELTEISGIARSLATADAWWVHNDSGDQPRVFLLSSRAEVLGTWEIRGAQARDWEDISSFTSNTGNHYLLLGDVGDNAASRSTCELYLVAEPTLPTPAPKSNAPVQTAEVLQTIVFRYEDGPRNCEAIAVDVAGQCVWLVEKSAAGTLSGKAAGVYRLDLRPFVTEWAGSTSAVASIAARSADTAPAGANKRNELQSEIVVAKRVADLSFPLVTGMDIAAAGDRLILRDYYQARMYTRQPDETWEQKLAGELPKPIQLPLEPQGEAIALCDSGSAVVTISEFAHQPLWRLALPVSPTPEFSVSTSRAQPNPEQSQARPALEQPQDPTPELKKLILPGEAFHLKEHVAFIFWPAAEKRQQPQPWVFYAPTLAAYPDEHERWMHQQFLDAGIAVAGIDVGEAYGSPAARQVFDAFYEHLVQQRGFAKKPVLLGRSRGGLWVTSWAADHPERFAGIAGIYPVFDWKTYPGVEKTAAAYGLTVAELIEREAELNPIARVPRLAQVGLPVYLIHGDQDQVVPLPENSQTFANHYQAAGQSDALLLEVIAGQGHNYWEGFFRSPKLVEFVIEHAKK